MTNYRLPPEGFRDKKWAMSLKKEWGRIYKVRPSPMLEGITFLELFHWAKDSEGEFFKSSANHVWYFQNPNTAMTFKLITGGK